MRSLFVVVVLCLLGGALPATDVAQGDSPLPLVYQRTQQGNGWFALSVTVGEGPAELRAFGSAPSPVASASVRLYTPEDELLIYRGRSTIERGDKTWVFVEEHNVARSQRLGGGNSRSLPADVSISLNGESAVTHTGPLKVLFWGIGNGAWTYELRGDVTVTGGSTNGTTTFLHWADDFRGGTNIGLEHTQFSANVARDTKITIEAKDRLMGSCTARPIPHRSIRITSEDVDLTCGGLFPLDLLPPAQTFTFHNNATRVQLHGGEELLIRGVDAHLPPT